MGDTGLGLKVDLKERESDLLQNFTSSHNQILARQDMESRSNLRKLEGYSDGLEQKNTQVMKQIDEAIDGRMETARNLIRERKDTYRTLEGDLDDRFNRLLGMDRDSKDAAEVFGKQARLLKIALSSENRARISDAKVKLKEAFIEQQKEQGVSLENLDLAVKDDIDGLKQETKNGVKSISRASSDLASELRKAESSWKKASKSSKKELAKLQNAAKRADR